MYYNTIYINMKYKVVSLLLLSSLALTGCSSSISLEFRPYKPFNYEGEAITQNSIEVSSKAGLEGNIVKTIQDISYRHLNNRTLANSEGEFKMLVLPIYFDANANSPHHSWDKEKPKEELTDEELTYIAREEKYTIYLENAFFGEAKMTDYESVASYYNKSSYGKLKITGEVAPWFGYSSKVSPTAKKSSAEDIVLAALSHAKTEMGKTYNQYDRDNDGYADDVFVIYDYPYEKDNSSDTIFWAFTSSFGSNKGQAHGNAYSWASSEFMHPSGNRVETYTYIHETGHLLGLVDYYNTSTSDKTYQPTGMFDMMDSNLGDHSAFSKYSLNWVKPTVITDPGTYKLKSLTKGEQFFLIPKTDNWNETVYDEYLLIEYFIPEGLNDSSSFPNYKYYDKNGNEQIFSYPTKYGVKVYHVDARLAYYTAGSAVISGTKLCLIDDPQCESKIQNYDQLSVYYAYQNEGSKQEEILYHLLESSGDNTFLEGKGATNETLFLMGDDFGYTKFLDFTFHDGSKCPFKFRIDMLTLSSASITFSQNN